MVEFLLVAPILCFLGFGIVQFGLIYHAKNVLSYATFEAARVGAVKHGSSHAMKEVLARRLAPIFGGDGSAAAVNRSLLRSKQAVSDLSRTQLRIINPTLAAFEDFGVADNTTGETIIPNAHLQHRERAVGARSGVTLQDANLLKIEVTHGYALTLPWFNVSLPGTEFTLKQIMARANPKHAQFYNRGLVPIKAVAMVRMQSVAKQSDIALAAAEAQHALQALSSLGQAALVFDTDDEDTQSMGSSPQSKPVADVENESSQDGNECLGPHGLPMNLVIESLTAELSTQCLYEAVESTDIEAMDSPAHSSDVSAGAPGNSVPVDAPTDLSHSPIDNGTSHGC